MTTARRSTARAFASVGAAALVVAAAAPFAGAQDAPDYPPRSPSLADGVCVGDIPYFEYQVDFGSDEFVGNPMTITFVNPDGPNVDYDVVVPEPGERQQVIWPGASEDPPDWPGWVNTGTVDEPNWVQSTADAGAFTRASGGVQVNFETNPTETITVTYPPASAVCANPPLSDRPDEPGPDQPGEPEQPGAPTTSEAPPVTTAGGQPPGLAVTGVEAAGLVLAGAALLGGGTALVVTSRRRSRSSA